MPNVTSGVLDFAAHPCRWDPLLVMNHGLAGASLIPLTGHI